MKLNEFKTTRINELNSSDLIGNFGSALLKQAGNKLVGNAKGNMSIKDRMAHDNFIRDFIGRAAHDIEAGISGGLIDPNPVQTTSPTATAQQAPAQQAPAQQATSPTATAQPAQQVPAQPTATAKPTAPTAPSPEQIRQQKQAVATKNAQAQMAPFSKMPNKQANAGQQAFGNMAGNLEKMGNKPAVTTLPPGSKQLGPKGRATLARLGKQKQDREGGKQQSLDLNEAEYPDTISSYIQKMFTQYMRGVNTKDPKIQAKVKEIADQAMNSYKSDKGKKALSQLANLGYSLSYSHAGSAGVASNTAMTPGQAIMRGMSQGLGISSADSTSAKAPQTATSTPTTSSTAPATPEQQKAEKTVYMQVKGMLDKLDKKGKQRILKALEKQLGNNVAQAQTTPAQPAPAVKKAPAWQGKSVKPVTTETKRK